MGDLILIKLLNSRSEPFLLLRNEQKIINNTVRIQEHQIKQINISNLVIYYIVTPFLSQSYSFGYEKV
jgi:hypothetical protein